ncbi:MAG TPA: hypothetical protein VFE13_15635 [Caulobacteraceae bacterium]|jgi:hypothetical protein|nr:hypothetical protein [Caulobacteraceae bacterium]
MKKLMLATLCAAATLGAAATADAAGGCGPGYHRGPYGGCRANRWVGRGPVVVARAPFVAVRVPTVGIYYPGRGYWYGGRYWGHRYAWHGGWRYR